MINKKNVLGKTPEELGDKDAIHVAIVAVRAAGLIKPGQRCGINEHQEAEPDEKGIGVADPFMKRAILTGQWFWLLLAQDQVPNVRHVWDHPKENFAPPTREPELPSGLESMAKDLGVTFHQLIEACQQVVDSDKKGWGEYSSVPYPGTLKGEALEEAMENIDRYDLWSEWSGFTGHEFENQGSACCPEYQYPEELFKLP